jgi:hypothetical protein
LILLFVASFIGENITIFFPWSPHDHHRCGCVVTLWLLCYSTSEKIFNGEGIAIFNRNPPMIIAFLCSSFGFSCGNLRKQYITKYTILFVTSFYLWRVTALQLLRDFYMKLTFYISLEKILNSLSTSISLFVATSIDEIITTFFPWSPHDHHRCGCVVTLWLLCYGISEKKFNGEGIVIFNSNPQMITAFLCSVVSSSPTVIYANKIFNYSSYILFGNINCWVGWSLLS